MSENIEAGDTWQAPSGVVFNVEEVSGGVVTVDTRLLADGTPATLENRQRYTEYEMREAAGWRAL